MTSRLRTSLPLTMRTSDFLVRIPSSRSHIHFQRTSRDVSMRRRCILQRRMNWSSRIRVWWVGCMGWRSILERYVRLLMGIHVGCLPLVIANLIHRKIRRLTNNLSTDPENHNQPPTSQRERWHKIQKPHIPHHQRFSLARDLEMFPPKPKATILRSGIRRPPA